MFIKQLFTSCISEYAYYIESDGEAAIIDPLRDIEDYINLAKERNATIKYIFETHFHADFVSGHLDLAKATNAPIIYGPDTQTKLPVYISKDKEIFILGKLTIEVMHTPGHTLESSCYLLKDEEGNDYSIFTGDTLFIGDVGRPDLAQIGDEMDSKVLAGILYDSLQNKIMSLGDSVIVYPGHGAGSSCGKNLGIESESTIGEQKQNNYALQKQTKEEFIKSIIDGLTAPPSYFPINAMINKEGYESFNSILEKGLTKLSIAEFNQKMKEDAIILDTRPTEAFLDGFIPNSIFIGLEGRFAEWAAIVLPFDKNIILVTEQGKEKESITRLTRVGFDKIDGYLDGSFEAWKQTDGAIDLLIDVEADELAMDIPYDDNLVVLDVRKEAEYGENHLKQAINIPLEDLVDVGNMSDLDDRHNIYVHCAGGYRSIIASTLLKRQGIHNIRNINGGFKAIMEFKDKFSFEKSQEVLN